MNKDQQNIVAFYNTSGINTLLTHRGFQNWAGVIQVTVPKKRMLPERNSKVIVLHVLGVVTKL